MEHKNVKLKVKYYFEHAEYIEQSDLRLSMRNTTQVQMTDTLKAVYCAWQNALMCLYMIVCFGLFMSSGLKDSGHPALQSKNELQPTTVKKHTSSQRTQVQSCDTLFCVSSMCCTCFIEAWISRCFTWWSIVVLDHTDVSLLLSERAHPSHIFCSLCFLFSNSVRFRPLLFPYGSVRPTRHLSSIISRCSPLAPVSFSLSLFHIDMLPLPRPLSFHLAQLPLGRAGPIHTHVWLTSVNIALKAQEDYSNIVNGETHYKCYAHTQAHITQNKYIHYQSKVFEQ